MRKRLAEGEAGLAPTKEAGVAATAGTGRRVLIDARPLQGQSSQRGIGSYVRGLLAGIVDEGLDGRTALLFDARLAVPELPSGGFVAYTVGGRYHDRLGLIEEAATLPGKLARIDAALYHATTLALPSRAPLPLVVTLHDLIPWALRGRGMLGERTRWWLGRRLLRRADLVLAVSQATAADARRLAGVREDRLQVISEGLGPGFVPAPGAAERVRGRYGITRPYLLYVGALDPRKEPQALVRAWRVAREAGADVELVLAGAGSEAAPSSVDGARKLGYLTNAELVDVYSAAACLVFPSRYEGFGLPVLEAMGCGCPVVAYRNSSVPEVAGDAARLVDDGDAAALGRAAAQAVLEPGRARRMRELGLAWARPFTWRRTARETFAAYRQVLERSGESSSKVGLGQDGPGGIRLR